MLDVYYVIATVAFFALMIGYVAACARLGRVQATQEGDHDAR